MKNDLPEWQHLHDAILDRIEVSWGQGLIHLHIRVGGSNDGSFCIKAEEALYLECPRRQPWGDSISINEVKELHGNGSATKRLEIEMQSGDLIIVEASIFRIQRDII